MPCLDENTVLRFVGGMLGSEEARGVEQHAATCDECRWLLSTAGAAILEEPSAAPTWGAPEARSAGEPPSAEVIGPGTVLSNTYRIERLIGRGGMGAVYAAAHLRLHRRFAVKVIAESLQAGEPQIARLRREAEVTSRIAHPHIVEVVDFNFTEAHTPYLVMELLAGESLASRLRRENVIEGAAFASIVRETASALEAAHQHGVVHRDLKPTNIFLCRQDGRDDFVKVVDFGLSKILSAHNELTAHWAVLGSPSYMAPEQARGDSALVDHRADIFALGAIMFRMLTGAAPFDGDSLPSTLFNVVYSEPADPERWRDVPASLRGVILRALAKERTARPQSMAALWDEVEAALAGADGPARAAPALRRALAGAVRRFARRPVVALLAGVALAAAVAWAGWRGLQQRQGRPAEVTAPAADGPSPSRADGAVLAVPATLPVVTPLPTTAPGASPRAESVATPRAAPPTATGATPHAKIAPRRRFGKLTVQSREGSAGPHVWAEVFLDGRPVGKTPLTLPSVAVGQHRVEVRRPGYSVSGAQWVRVRPDSRAVVSFVLRSP